MRRKGLTPELLAGRREIERELAAMGPAPEEEDTTCVECGGVTRCSPEPEHAYYTAADARQPAKTLSPDWRDPLVHNTNTTKET